MKNKEKKLLFEVEEIIVGISAVLLVVSAFLPWAKAGSYAPSGLSGDGQILIAIGAVAIILLFVDIIYKISAWVPMILGVIALVIGVIDFTAMYNTVSSISSTAGYVGIGLYIAIIAAVGVTVGAILDLMRNQ
jgi:hypothetical protein